MVYLRNRNPSREWDIENPLGFQGTNGSRNLGQNSRPSIDFREKLNMLLCRFCRSCGQKREDKRKVIIDKYLDIARELNKKKRKKPKYKGTSGCTWNDMDIIVAAIFLAIDLVIRKVKRIFFLFRRIYINICYD